MRSYRPPRSYKTGLPILAAGVASAIVLVAVPNHLPGWAKALLLLALVVLGRFIVLPPVADPRYTHMVGIKGGLAAFLLSFIGFDDTSALNLALLVIALALVLILVGARSGLRQRKLSEDDRGVIAAFFASILVAVIVSIAAVLALFGLMASGPPMD